MQTDFTRIVPQASAGKGIYDPTSPSVSSFLCFRKKENAHIFFTGRLPHWEQQDVLQYITFRLADSLPAVKLEEYMSIRRELLKEYSGVLTDCPET